MDKKYFLRKNEKNIEVNKVSGTERLPYFTFFEIVDQPGEQKPEFKEIAVLWKSKSGKGYSGKSSKAYDPAAFKKVKVETSEEIRWD